jgi:rod shape-determining protein MreC
MDSFFVRFKNSLVLTALVLLQTIALAVQVQRPAPNAGLDVGGAPKVTLLRYWILATVTPLEAALHGSGLRIRNVWSNYIDLRHAREQNRQLQAEILRLREEQAAFAEDARQGRRVQALLQFKQAYITSTVAAQVIGTGGSDRSRVLYLDKGADDGLKADQAVITPDGIVGKLHDVLPKTAQLLLINDPTWGAGVILETTRIRGIIRGTAGGKVQINNLTADERIKPGERVITSGGDQVFPRGLPVGVIESIAPDRDHQPYVAITLKPAADLSRLEEVLVVTGTQTTMPPAAQQDAAIAEAASAANSRAAQMAAERLPTARDPAAAAAPAASAPGSAAGPPNAGVPHAPAPLHPDKFTPGATPSADQLKPGAPASRQP